MIWGSNMKGKKSGVAVQIKAIQPKAVDTHCHGHSLNLAVKDIRKDVENTWKYNGHHRRDLLLVE